MASSFSGAVAVHPGRLDLDDPLSNGHLLPATGGREQEHEHGTERGYLEANQQRLAHPLDEGGPSIHKSPRRPRRGSTEALGRLFELASLLAGPMDRRLAEERLTRARTEVIWRLHQTGPVTQRELGEALRCTPRNVTGLVDALEAGGLVAPDPHPTDRRAAFVTLTERGRGTASEWQAGYQELAGRLFGGVDATEVAGFVATLDRVLERFRDEDPSSTG
jgi:DNA-binding MarR family transcriptional regulator